MGEKKNAYILHELMERVEEEITHTGYVRGSSRAGGCNTAERSESVSHECMLSSLVACGPPLRPSPQPCNNVIPINALVSNLDQMTRFY